MNFKKRSARHAGLFCLKIETFIFFIFLKVIFDISVISYKLSNLQCDNDKGEIKVMLKRRGMLIEGDFDFDKVFFFIPYPKNLFSISDDELYFKVYPLKLCPKDDSGVPKIRCQNIGDGKIIEVLRDISYDNAFYRIFLLDEPYAPVCSYPAYEYSYEKNQYINAGPPGMICGTPYMDMMSRESGRILHEILSYFGNFSKLPKLTFSTADPVEQAKEYEKHINKVVPVLLKKYKEIIKNKR